jgi:hypothetical protein
MPYQREAFPISPSVAANSSNAETFALQAYVDPGDGTGPQLRTIFLEAVAIFPLDANGNPIETDELRSSAAWRKELLDEVRAIRIGMQRLTENTRYMSNEELSLIEQAQEQNEDGDILNPSREAAENKPGDFT